MADDSGFPGKLVSNLRCFPKTSLIIFQQTEGNTDSPAPLAATVAPVSMEVNQISKLLPEVTNVEVEVSKPRNKKEVEKETELSEDLHPIDCLVSKCKFI